MKIILKVDCEGEPYLALLSEKPVLFNNVQCVESELLERFISKAKERGVKIQNESSEGSSDGYASIRLSPKKIYTVTT